MAGKEEINATLLRHVGLLSAHSTGAEHGVGECGVDVDHLKRLLFLLEAGLEEGDGTSVACLLVAVQSTLQSRGTEPGEGPPLDRTMIKRLKALLWRIISPDTNFSTRIVEEGCTTVLSALHLIYPTLQEQQNLLIHLLEEDIQPRSMLASLMLEKFAKELDSAYTSSLRKKQIQDSLTLNTKIFQKVTAEAKCHVTTVQTATEDDITRLISECPKISASLQYISTVVNSVVSEIMREEDLGDYGHDTLVDIINMAMEAASELVDHIQALVQDIGGHSGNTKYRLEALERVLQGSVLGLVLLPLVTCLADIVTKGEECEHCNIPALVSLLTRCCQVTKMAQAKTQDVPADAEEEGVLGGVKVPCPWSTSRVLESPHPVKDNYKMKETVQIEGARYIYLRFDSRCSTQYDYDKLSVYAGTSAACKKIYEYGGNAHGFGSRSVLGGGWPKDPIKIEGDTVTFSLEVRSGREQNTPDRAIWGFKVIVRAHESEDTRKLPFLCDLTLSLSVLLAENLQILYNGKQITQEEQDCSHLLQSRLLQKCSWEKSRKSSGLFCIEEEEIPRIKLPQEQIRRLRELSGLRIPHMRKSIRDVIEPEVLEEAVLSAVIKHLSLGDILNNFSVHEAEFSLEYFTTTDIMMESYHKLYALLRKLQTIAELETHIENDIEDLKEKRIKIGETFFANYGHDESTLKDLALICFIKDIDFDDKKPQRSLEELAKVLEFEVLVNSTTKPLIKTSQIIHAILLRIELLLHVSIDTTLEQSKYSSMMSRSLQSWPSGDNKTLKKQLSFDIEQSLDDSILQIPKLRMKRKIRKMKQTAANNSKIDLDDDKLPQTVILDQLFQFIGSHPEKAVSPWKFLEAVSTRRERSISRKFALMFMKQLLSSSQVSGGGTYLVNTIASLIQAGPKLNELTCGGLVEKVREAYGEIMTLVVQLVSKFPSSCRGSIGMLCTVPYERSEERCLVRSGLVNLLDKLCSQTSKGKHADNSTSGFDANKSNYLSEIAWAGFKVLANRCMKWQEEGGDLNLDEFKELGLAHQVSILLTHNLARATEMEKESTENEALQEILQMLNSMSTSKMGKDILSQPSCISKLLSLLLEPKLSPKMILTIIQLCHSALPLMSLEGFSQISLPNWNLGQEEVKVANFDPPQKIVSLIFAKLADFLIPGYQISALVPGRVYNQTVEKKISIGESESLDDLVLPGDLPDMDRTLSLFLHKREDQSANEIIQQLLNVSSELRIFRFTGNQNMEKIVTIDKELNKHHKAEIVTDEATLILRRAVKLAQQGFVVSVGPPPKHEDLLDEKKNAVEQIAKDRNIQLSKFDPARPFISSTVANSMACELIMLIHSLFRSSTASVWEDAINDFILSKLSDLNKIAGVQEALFSGTSFEIFDVYNKARDVLSVLAALGGYTESVKPGAQVKITGPNMDESTYTVLSISETTGQAMVQFNVPADVSHFPRPSNTILVPFSRITTMKRTDPVQLFMPLSDDLIEAFQSLLVPDPTGVDPLSTALPAHGEGRSLKLATARVLAEIRTRTIQVMSCFLEEPGFACRYLQTSCQAVDMLKYMSKDCLPSDRFEMVETTTRRLRNLYRDCVKPPAPPSRRSGSKHKVMVWDSTKVFPPLKSVLFTHNMLGVTYYTEPLVTQGLPRGIFVYSNQMIPPSANHFYFEIDILSLGDSPDDSGTPLISVGLAPLADKKEGVWSNPVGSMLFHNNGRVVHYNGSSLLQWRSLRFETQLNPGDTIGIGWEKVFEASGNIPSSGSVYFTLNSVKLDQALEEVAGNMYPVVHIQRKNTRIKANFGSTKFAYLDAKKKVDVSLDETVEENDSSDGLGNMPFHTDSDSSGSSSPERVYAMGAGNRRINTYSCRTALTPKALRDYHVGSEEFRTQLANEIWGTTGNHIQQITTLDEDSDSEDDDDDFDIETVHREDVNSLLVKAWETRVFPLIRRRFRNEAERRDGLEQIKGALALGMADIARQTVEFLYEENGGIPRDVHLPTIEDIKEEMSKFTIEKVKKGQQVIISDQAAEGVQMPKFCVPIMMKTLGLPGEVLEIDSNNELVQVESYLKSEGILVRFWYPVNVLEKPTDCTVKVAVTGAQMININNVQVHKELLSWEFAMTRMFCRESYIKLLEHSRNTEICSYIPVDEHSSKHTMLTSNILLLKDIDIENLQYISNHSLMNPPNGNVLEKNLNISSSKHILNNEKGTITSLFYNSCELLNSDLHDFIIQAASKGEDYVIELTTQVCVVLQLSPEFFTTEEIAINDISTLNSCIQFPGAAFTAASVRVTRSIEDVQDLKELTLQLQTMDGCYVKYNGQISSRDIIQYPMETSGYKDPIYSAFPPVIMASDKVRVSHSGGEDLGVKLYLHFIPQQFPLAVVYIEKILEIVQLKEELPLITEGIIYHIIEIVSGFIWRYEMPQIVKERVFLVLAELIRIYKTKQKNCGLDPHLPQMQLYLQLQNELKNLYDYESDRKLHKRFSSYLQSLFEISGTVTDLLGISLTPTAKKSRSPTPVSGSDKEGSPSPVSLGNTLRRQLRPRRTRVSSTSSTTSESSITSTNSTSEKYWYTKQQLLTNSLRYIINKEDCFENQANEFLKEVFSKLPKLDDHTRLLILKGVPKHIEHSNLLTVINKILAPFGGSFQNEIFIHPVDSAATEAVHQTSTTRRIRTTSIVEPVVPNNRGTVVVEVRTNHKIDIIKEEFLKSPVLAQPGEFDIADESDPCLGLSVYKVTSSFNVENTQHNNLLESYLKFKLFDKDGHLKQDFSNALEDIFLSSYLTSQRLNEKIEDDEIDDEIYLKQRDILLQAEGNLMFSFFSGIKPTKRALIEGVKEVLLQYGSESTAEVDGKENVPELTRKGSQEKEVTKGATDSFLALRVVREIKDSGENIMKPETDSPDLASEDLGIKSVKERCLQLDGFVRFITEYGTQDVRSVWVGLQACGINLQLQRTIPTDLAQLTSLQAAWDLNKDKALVELGNSLGRSLSVSALRLSAHEIYLTEAQISSPQFRPLQGLAAENIRCRYALLVALNQGVADLLPLVDFRAGHSYQHSLAAVLGRGRDLIFYSVKEVFLRHLLDSTHQREPEHAPPEILVDPVEEIGNTNEDVCSSLFCAALNQLAGVRSAALNVSIATGGDPQFPFNVKMAGDEVHGNSGSFRHFLSAVVEQLHGPTLNLLVPYRGMGPYTGRYFLKPGPTNYGEEKMLQFLGQLLGISLRAGIPLPLDLMPSFWMSLANQPLTAWDQVVKDIDPVTWNYVASLEALSEDKCEEFINENNQPKFTFSSLGGSYVELCPEGVSRSLAWENLQEYIELVKACRLKEWDSRERMAHIQAGLATIVPLSFLLTVFSPWDLELVLCGVPTVNLKFIRAHTIYQVGISETDPHVEFFWSALDSFTQEELGRFIKFSCNQDRIPMSGDLDALTLPPYPMKIAPPDKREGDPDQQFIRVETCMFMVKLPRYSTFETMRDKLLYAVSCASDPLSG